MGITIEEPQELPRAVRIARSRGILPTTADTQGLRALDRELRRNSVFSARTNNAQYLQKMRDVTSAIIEGNMSPGQARATLRATLRAMGYTPEGGFPGDDERQIPEAVLGTIQDLSSDSRLALIVRTQESLVRNRAIVERGSEPFRINAFPAWELVRVSAREHPRDWRNRFRIAENFARQNSGGEQTVFTDEGRLVARKDDLAFWNALGSSSLFDDALDVAHPPFAFNSGMGFREVEREEAQRMGLVDDAEQLAAPEPPDHDGDGQPDRLPPPSFGASGLDADFINELAAELDAHEDEHGRLTL